MIFAGIVAGGVGKRFGSEIPKQFLTLGNKPIIIQTIEKFLICPKIEAICIGANESWISYAKKMLSEYNLNTEKVIITAGGALRNDTIMNIISALEEKFGCSDEHVIITHDAVRPFVSLRIIEENIKVAPKFGACDTVVCANDTVIKSDVSLEKIEEIPNRKFVFLGQTPQSFNMNKFKALFNSLTEDEKNALTDACKIFTLKNEEVKLVAGEFSNFKITTPIDYKLAQTLI